MCVCEASVMQASVRCVAVLSGEWKDNTLDDTLINPPNMYIYASCTGYFIKFEVMKFFTQ